MKKLIFAGFVVVLNCVFVYSQSQATSSKQTDKDGIQCSSSGIGIGKDNQEAARNAEINRELAEQKAKKKRKKLRESFTNETGGGVASCQKYKNVTSYAAPETHNQSPGKTFRFDPHKNDNSLISKKGKRRDRIA